MYLSKALFETKEPQLESYGPPFDFYISLKETYYALITKRYNDVPGLIFLWVTAWL